MTRLAFYESVSAAMAMPTGAFRLPVDRVCREEITMATNTDKDEMRSRLDLNAAERELLLRGLRTMWSLHINAQISAVARSSGGDDSLRQALEATDEQLAEIRRLAARLGAAVFG